MLSFNAVPVRLNVGVMSFLICFVAYVLRANLAINILEMTYPSNGKDVPDYGPRYDWSVSRRSALLGAYFWGSFVSTVPAGFLAEWFGGKSLTTIALVISAIMTALTPIMCEMSFYAVYANRFLIGVVGGVFFPALHNLVSKWAPPDEKSKFVAALLGGNLGTVFIWQVSGFIILNYGWESAFYAVAVLVSVVTIAWMYLVTDSPSTHPRISPREVQYIEQSLDGHISKEKAVPPYLRIMTSLPFWSLILLHYGNLWGLFFLLTAAPTFMKEALDFDLAAAGFLASLPHLSRFLAGFCFGNIGDLIRKIKLMSPTMMRKVFCLTSHVVPGILLISMTYVGGNAYACVAIMTASLGLNGSATLTNLQNTQDLAPNFAGTLYSIINFIGTSSGFISPLVVSYFTSGDSSPDSWNMVFIIGSIFYIVPTFIFWVFGTAEVQPWNEIRKEGRQAPGVVIQK